ncbi:hypothetical protein [Sulfurospirillum arcachonense]|uniref:hypothetical protein n=1 Tax=Sulfurospirillum arcachonense TaxID=57666 RepID=UPI000468BF28|nr:hypothetical protein [Sulfurospirillum arcachonense]
MNNSQIIEKSLLSIIVSGNYLSTYEIVKLGEPLDIELAHKKRSLILQTLFIQARNTNQEKRLTNKILTLLDKKEETYNTLAKNYKNSATIIGQWIQKIHSTKMLIQKGVVYG